jgi:hypothetical protein
MVPLARKERVSGNTYQKTKGLLAQVAAWTLCS